MSVSVCPPRARTTAIAVFLLYSVNENINEEERYQNIFLIKGIGTSGGSWDKAKRMEVKSLTGNLPQNKYYVTTPSPHPTPARRASQESKG